MSRQAWSTRFALWVAVCALLLKAAVPMLATASAHAQGKALVEVCTVYGVATVSLEEGKGSAPASDHAGAHGGDHCTLTALMSVAAPEPQEATPFVASQPMRAARVAAPSPSTAADACATWVARLKHGPPLAA